MATVITLVVVHYRTNIDTINLNYIFIVIINTLNMDPTFSHKVNNPVLTRVQAHTPSNSTLITETSCHTGFHTLKYTLRVRIFRIFQYSF